MYFSIVNPISYTHLLYNLKSFPITLFFSCLTFKIRLLMPLWQRIRKNAHEGLYMVAIMASACTFWKSYLASRVFLSMGAEADIFV